MDRERLKRVERKRLKEQDRISIELSDFNKGDSIEIDTRLLNKLKRKINRRK